MVAACLAVPPHWLTDGFVPQAPVPCCSERTLRMKQTDGSEGRKELKRPQEALMKVKIRLWERLCELFHSDLMRKRKISMQTESPKTSKQAFWTTPRTYFSDVDWTAYSHLCCYGSDPWMLGSSNMEFWPRSLVLMALPDFSSETAFPQYR